jgi:hypothetical protein
VSCGVMRRRPFRGPKRPPDACREYEDRPPAVSMIVEALAKKVCAGAAMRSSTASHTML